MRSSSKVIVVAYMFVFYVSSFIVALVVRHRQLPNIPPQGRIQDVNIFSPLTYSLVIGIISLAITVVVFVVVITIASVLPHQRAQRGPVVLGEADDGTRHAAR